MLLTLNKKLFLTFFSLVSTLFLAVIITTPTLASAATPSKNSLSDQLLGIAQSKLDAEYDVLTSGDSTKLTKANLPVSGFAAQGINDTANTQLRIHDGLASHGLRYSQFSSKLNAQKIDISNGNATITADETVTLVVDNGSKDPVNSKKRKTHIFNFSLQDGQWSLTQDKVLNDLAPVTPEPGEFKVQGAPINVLSKPKNKSSVIDNTVVNASIVHGGFNPSNAVNYARSYWNNYNSAYRTYSNDCTNFVSQALNWGGWQHNGGWYDDTNYWWYSPSIVVAWGGRAESRSWIQTNYFWWFARNSGRARNAAYLSDFRPGDVLQIDQSVPDGYLDHTEIVTSKDSSGNIYLTSHSVNVLDKPFWTIYYQYPGAAFYGSIMNYSY